jgi:hypothetical protein
VDCDGDRRKPTSVIVTGAGIAIVETFELRAP